MAKIKYSFFATISDLKEKARTNLMHSWGNSVWGSFFVISLPVIALFLFAGLIICLYFNAAILGFVNGVIALSGETAGFNPIFILPWGKFGEFLVKIQPLIDKKATLLFFFILLFIALLPLRYGIQNFYLRMANDDDPKKSIFFSGYGKRTFKLYMIEFVRSISLILMIIATRLLYLVMTAETVNKMFMISLIVLIVLFFVLTIISQNGSLMVYRVFIENPDMKIKDIFSTAKYLISTRRGAYLKLYWSFIFLEFCCIFTLGIARWWLIPYKQESSAFFYKDLKD